MLICVCPPFVCGWGGVQSWEWCSDFSFVHYPVMIILASKPQIWPCFAVDRSISGERAVLPWLRSLSAAKLVGNESQVHSMEDILSVVTGGHLGSERGYKGRITILGEDKLSCATLLSTFVCLVAE